MVKKYSAIINGSSIPIFARNDVEAINSTVQRVSEKIRSLGETSCILLSENKNDKKWEIDFKISIKELKPFQD